jgi:hypothetical protein
MGVNLKKFYLGILGIIGILFLIVFLSDLSSSDNTIISNSSAVDVKVSYSGPWTGSIYDKTGSRTVQGIGPQTYPLGTNPGFVSVNFEKNDTLNSTEDLSAQIVDGNGKVIETQSTTGNGRDVTLSHPFNK